MHGDLSTYLTNFDPLRSLLCTRYLLHLFIYLFHQRGWQAAGEVENSAGYWIVDPHRRADSEARNRRVQAVLGQRAACQGPRAVHDGAQNGGIQPANPGAGSVPGAARSLSGAVRRSPVQFAGPVVFQIQSQAAESSTYRPDGRGRPAPSRR